MESSPTASRIAMVVLAAYSARLRWDRLGASGLYLDDAWVAISTRVHGMSDLLRIGYTSPGFVIFLVRPWARLFGSSVTSLQLLPFLLGVIGPPLCFFVARSWKVRFGPAALAGVLLAVSPIHRLYSANLKQYTAESVATLLLLWGGSLVVAEPGNRRRWAWLMVGGVAATVLSVSEAIIVLAVLAGVTIAAAQHEHTKLPRRAIATIEGYGLFAITWYAVALKPHLNPTLYAFWRGFFIHVDAGIGTVPGQIVARLHRLFDGFSGLYPGLTLVLIALSALVLLLRRPTLGVTLAAPTCLAIILAFGQVSPLGTGRTDIYLYPTLALLIATGLDEIIHLFSGPVARPMALATLAIACLLLVTVHPGLPPYLSEDVKPLVQRVERERRPGEMTIIYPMASFGYGLSTKSAVHLRVDNRYTMSFFVEPEDPQAMVLPMERSTPERYAEPIDKLTAGRQRVWLLGTHVWPDWHDIRKLIAARGFRVERYYETHGGILILYQRS